MPSSGSRICPPASHRVRQPQAAARPGQGTGYQLTARRYQVVFCIDEEQRTVRVLRVDHRPTGTRATACHSSLGPTLW